MDIELDVSMDMETDMAMDTGTDTYISMDNWTQMYMQTKEMEQTWK